MGARDNKKNLTGRGFSIEENKLFVLLEKHPLLQCCGIAVVLNLLVEIFSRRSVLGGFEYLISSPLIFVYNSLIILLTLAIALLVRKRVFALTVVSVIWLGLGITNCVLLGFRTTPLAAIDFQLFKSVKDIIEVYITPVQMVMVIAAGVLVLAGAAVIWKKSSRYKVNYRTNGIIIATLAIALLSATNISVKAETLASSFGNLAEAYEEYGFAYCFSESLIDRGISRPVGYSAERMEQIVSLVSDEWNDRDNGLADNKAFQPEDKTNTSQAVEKSSQAGAATEGQPNIIMLQLESFFDVNHIKGLTYSENPVPVFQSLKESYSSGFVTVPSIGAGTANTEFEVISGMSMDYFGTGEYPYKTIMKRTASESTCTDLKKYGYTSHAIHNHKGTFYDRHLVYPNLGFDTFTSLEYMNNVEKTPKKWAKDNVLTGEVMKTLNSTDGQDFIYTVTVQSHGKYPEQIIDPNQTITVNGYEDEGRTNAFEYYVNQLKQVDNFIGDLTNTLSAYDEPVVLVMFGDHLPSLDLTNDLLENGDIFQTEYVLWSNFPMEKEDRDLYAFQLSSYVMDRLDISGRVLAERHKVNLNSSADLNYEEDLELLEYDMLYGNHYIYGGINGIQPTQMVMGTEPITLTGARNLYDCVYVEGDNFTKWSFIEINGKRKKTMFVDESTLLVTEEMLKPGDQVTVVQAGDNDDYEILSQIGPYVYRADLVDVSDISALINPAETTENEEPLTDAA